MDSFEALEIYLPDNEVEIKIKENPVCFRFLFNVLAECCPKRFGSFPTFGKEPKCQKKVLFSLLEQLF